MGKVDNLCIAQVIHGSMTHSTGSCDTSAYTPLCASVSWWFVLCKVIIRLHECKKSFTWFSQTFVG